MPLPLPSLLPSSRPRPAGRVAPVLLVEDDPDIREVLADCLEEHGFPVVAAADAAAAVAALAREPRPALVVTDINLGPGGSGLDVAEASRRAAPGVPVVFITGRLDMLRERGLRDGEFAVPKPFPVSTLVGVVRRFATPSASGRAALASDG